MAKIKVGVDVGVTFTDVLLMNLDSGATYRSKAPSTPQDQSIGILDGILKACDKAGAGGRKDGCREYRHGGYRAPGRIECATAGHVYLGHH